MPQLGRIEQWNDERGYGFVRPLQSQAGDNAARAFVHIRRIAKAGRRPANGDLIRYDSERDTQGRLNAVNVSFVNAEAMRAQAQRRAQAKAAARQRPASGWMRDGMHRLILTATITALVVGEWLRLWPAMVTLAYVVMSAASFLAYFRDKNASENGGRRTPEATLHVSDLLCGWPGGLLAQQTLRHKTRKDSFQTTFWGTVMLNFLVFLTLIWLLSARGTTP